MSLYAEYLTERTFDSIIETDWGFATYRYINEGRSVYIVDIYTNPESRNKGQATSLADQIAKEALDKGCKEMLGSVVPSTKGSTASLKILMAYGMALHSAGQDYIFLRKDL